MSRKITRVLILGAGGSAGANLRKSLFLTGQYQLIGADIKPERLHNPQWFAGIPCPPCSSPDRPRWEAETAQTWQPDLVIAQADTEVTRLRQSTAWKRKGILPPDTHFTICHDKLILANYLASKNIPVPNSYAYPCTRQTIHKNLVWVRARTGAGSKAALPCPPEFVDHWVSYWAHHHARPIPANQFMVSDYLPGPEYALQAIYNQGQLLAISLRQRLEYVFQDQMPSGQSSTPSKALLLPPDGHPATTVALNAIQALNDTPHGIYGVDMKCDETNQPKVTEINLGRFYTTSFFTTAAGLNLPHIYTQTSLGKPPPPPTNTTYNTIWIRTLDDEPILLHPPPKHP